MDNETTRRDRVQARWAQAIIWIGLAVAAMGVALWAFGRLGMLAPIVAGAAAVVVVAAGPVLKARRLRSGQRS